MNYPQISERTMYRRRSIKMKSERTERKEKGIERVIEGGGGVAFRV